MSNFFYRYSDYSLFQKAFKDTEGEDVVVDLLSSDESLKESEVVENKHVIRKDNRFNQESSFNRFFGPRKSFNRNFDMKDFSSWKNKNYRETEKQIGDAGKNKLKFSFSDFMNERTGEKTYNDADKNREDNQKAINELVSDDPTFKKFSLNDYMRRLEEKTRVKSETRDNEDLIDSIGEITQDITPDSTQDENFDEDNFNSINVEGFVDETDFRGDKYSVDTSELDEMKTRLEELRTQTAEINELIEDMPEEEVPEFEFETADGEKLFDDEDDELDSLVDENEEIDDLEEIDEEISEEGETYLDENENNQERESESEENQDEVDSEEAAEDQEENLDKVSGNGNIKIDGTGTIVAGGASGVSQTSGVDANSSGNNSEIISAGGGGYVGGSQGTVVGGGVGGSFNGDSLTTETSSGNGGVGNGGNVGGNQGNRINATITTKSGDSANGVPQGSSVNIINISGSDDAQGYTSVKSKSNNNIVSQEQGDKSQEIIKLIDKNDKEKRDIESKLRQAEIDKLAAMKSYELRLKQLEKSIQEKDKETQKRVLLEKIKNDNKLTEVRAEFKLREDEIRRLEKESALKSKIGELLKKELKNNLNISNLEMNNKLLEITSMINQEKQKAKANKEKTTKRKTRRKIDSDIIGGIDFD